MHFSRIFVSLVMLGVVSTPLIGQANQQPNTVATSDNPSLFGAAQCMPPQPERIAIANPPSETDIIHILSARTETGKDKVINFSGDVVFYSNERKILADYISVDQLNAIIEATDNIQFQGNGMNVFADTLIANENDNHAQMTNTSYLLSGRPGQGQAEQLTLSADGTVVLNSANFTTCPDLSSPDWLMSASEISINSAENEGQAYHVRFEVADIPVLYLPYFSFPVTDQRKSGFLIPTISSSNNSGLEIFTPYYINIAENMDATITPHYMSKRGLQLQTEFRYLTGLQTGIVKLEYLNKDDELKANDDARYLFRMQHIGTFAENFRGYIDYTTVSDDNYLVDIGSKEYNSNDTSLSKTGEISYFTEDWRSTIKLQGFDVLGNHTESYKTIPQLEFEGHQTIGFGDVIWDFYSELSRFETSEPNAPEADRFHVETGFTLPYSSPAAFLTSEVKILQTNYDQSDIEFRPELDSSVSRTLPKLRLHGGINLERDFNELGYIQTLEPQLQYLYVGDKDQENIGMYDTTNLQDDYNGLFRDRRYSGLDRILEANQLSWGITSRTLDDQNRELFSFSLGRIFYFNDTNVDLISDEVLSTNKSPVAAELFVQIDKRWQLTGGIQYDTENSVTDKSNIRLDYRQDEKHLIQLNHRYNRDVSGSSVEQMSLMASYAISKDWQFVGRQTHDLIRDRSLESYAGFQYESCCWSIRIAYSRHINTNLDEDDFYDEGRDEFNSGIMIQFSLKGFSPEPLDSGTQEMFESGIFGYKRPYFLNY